MKQADKTDSFSARLLAWFDRHGRKALPWQTDRSPYRVWVSEIMLQQTRVATVIPYFERFMASFPTIADLAEADTDHVLHHWTGLGYYARARNLHRAAGIVHRELGGELPDTIDALCELPGIGRSTAGAIVALAHDRRAVILDGNVKRVLTRYHGIEGWPDRSDVQKQLWALADRLTPEDHCAAYTQAIMDLGATVCVRGSPACPTCPLQQDCLAFREDRTTELPHPRPRKPLPVRSTVMLLCTGEDGRILLQRRPPQGIWGGLWSFPELDGDSQTEDFIARYGLGEVLEHRQWDSLRHTFTHFHLDITPVRLTLDTSAGRGIADSACWHWYDPASPAELGLAAPVKKLLSLIEK